MAVAGVMGEEEESPGSSDPRSSDPRALAFCFLCSFLFVFPIVWLRFPWSFPWCAYFLCYIILVNGLLPLIPTFGAGTAGRKRKK